MTASRSNHLHTCTVHGLCAVADSQLEILKIRTSPLSHTLPLPPSSQQLSTFQQPHLPMSSSLFPHSSRPPQTQSQCQSPQRTTSPPLTQSLPSLSRCVSRPLCLFWSSSLNQCSPALTMSISHKPEPTAEPKPAKSNQVFEGVLVEFDIMEFCSTYPHAPEVCTSCELLDSLLHSSLVATVGHVQSHVVFVAIDFAQLQAVAGQAQLQAIDFRSFGYTSFLHPYGSTGLFLSSLPLSRPRSAEPRFHEPAVTPGPLVRQCHPGSLAPLLHLGLHLSRAGSWLHLGSSLHQFHCGSSSWHCSGSHNGPSLLHLFLPSLPPSLPPR